MNNQRSTRRGGQFERHPAEGNASVEISVHSRSKNRRRNGHLAGQARATNHRQLGDRNSHYSLHIHSEGADTSGQLRDRCKVTGSSYPAAVKRVTLSLFFIVIAARLHAGTGASSSAADPSSWEVAVESGYLLGIFGNPHSYEVNPDFLTVRVRWGFCLNSNGFLRGYNQVYLSGEAQPIIRGVENHYFGINLGSRYNFVQPSAKLVPYISGGLGLGWIDSHPDNYGSQGQDFTFNILAAIGVSYHLRPHWSLEAGVLYEHFSNGGQTDPNPSLNLFGPQLGIAAQF